MNFLFQILHLTDIMKKYMYKASKHMKGLLLKAKEVMIKVHKNVSTPDHFT